MDELIKRLQDFAAGTIRDEDAQLALDAADAIEELSRDLDSMNEANIALYGALPKWVPVTECLPNEDGFTLIFTAHGHAGVCYFTNGWWGGYDKDGITHWMPLPPAPKEE